MSDYLSSLVDRSLERADVIQPRLPSLFEPAPVIGEPIAGWGQESEPMMAVIEQSVPTTAERPVARPFSPIARIFDRFGRRRSTEPTTEPDFRSLPSQHDRIEMSPPPSLSPTPIERVEPTPDLANIPTVSPLPLPAQIVDRQIPPEDRVAADRLEPPTQTPPVRAESALPDRSVTPELPIQTSPDPATPSDRPIPSSERLPNLNPAPIAVRDTAERIEPRPLPTDFAIDRQQPQLERTTIEQMRAISRTIEPEVLSTVDRSPQPTIQVTIGRIEVRATTTAPAARSTDRVRSPSPAMSLDEYLARRGGGK